MTTELKRCPNPQCDNAGSICRNPKLNWCYCNKCWMNGPHMDTVEEAIDSWNSLPREKEGEGLELALKLEQAEYMRDEWCRIAKERDREIKELRKLVDAEEGEQRTVYNFHLYESKLEELKERIEHMEKLEHLVHTPKPEISPFDLWLEGKWPATRYEYCHRREACRQMRDWLIKELEKRADQNRTPYGQWFTMAKLKELLGVK